MKQYQIKLNQLDRELNYLPLHRQVDIINNIIANIQQKRFYQNHLIHLDFYLIA